ncbi:MAG TPA: DUF4920 domain-containing protein [Planctomycetes bacterium]|nr:DUF4920 domain-containing protein [Planctomycetota bacterium]
MRSLQILTAVSVVFSLTTASNAQAKPEKLDAKAYDHFGTGITVGETPISLAAALKNADKLTGKTIRVQATITGVCQTKGCWMNLGKPDEKGNPPLFVKFKDYGFFMPKDSSGRTAIVEGTMTLKQETVAETKHYLEDAGKHEQAQRITEGRKILRFMASGVAIKKTPALDLANFDQFGAGIKPGKAPLTLKQVMANPGQYIGKPVRMQAQITAVCQSKGCWMHLGKQLANGNPPVMVKFKDYGFFMPKDASGRLAVVEGQLAFKQETVAETKHYLEDAGKHELATKVTEGRKILRFMADGVALEKVAVIKSAAKKK